MCASVRSLREFERVCDVTANEFRFLDGRFERAEYLVVRFAIKGLLFNGVGVQVSLKFFVYRLDESAETRQA